MRVGMLPLRFVVVGVGVGSVGSPDPPGGRYRGGWGEASQATGEETSMADTNVVVYTQPG